jgi:hypothetical protein
LEAVLRGPSSKIDAKQVHGKFRKYKSRKPRQLRIITVHKEEECRCAKLTRFLARFFDFLITDLTCWLTQFILYQYFLNFCDSFWELIGGVQWGIDGVIGKILRFLL